MRRTDTKGFTLVEMILAIVILGISALLLTSTFASAMKLMNRATLYKNISTSASGTVELAEKQESETPVSPDPSKPKRYSYTVDMKEESSTLTITYKKDGAQKTTSAKGEYLFGKGVSSVEKAELTYKEFLPSNFSYDIPAEPVDNGK